MNLYLAAAMDRLVEINSYAVEAAGAGHRIVSSWHSGTSFAWLEKRHPEDVSAQLARIAVVALDEIQRADTLICFTPRTTRGGRDFEAGYARGINRAVWRVGPPDNLFLCLPEIRQFDNWPECLAVLRTKGSTHER